MSTLAELQTYVRSTLDVTATDLPDALLNVWLLDGYNRALTQEERWPFFEIVTSLTAVVGQRSYAINAIPSVPGTTLRSVSALIDTGALGNGWGLQLVNHDAASAKWVGVLDTPGQPLFYSKRTQQVHLWPKPNALYQYTVLGYRTPVNWILLGSGSAPDCDDRLHIPIADWALCRYFKQQEDPVMAQAYEQSFKDGVAMAHDSIMRIDADYPLILNRGFASPSAAWWLQSLGRNLGH